MITFADNVIVGPDSPFEDDDEGDAVTSVPADTLSTGDAALPSTREGTASTIYDLQGRRVTTPQPGVIYIYQGKKVVWAQ